jgi:hypothetical protein
MRFSSWTVLNDESVKLKRSASSWAYLYFEQTQVAVAKQGDPIAESVWKHLSAIQWEHIHLVGAYHFTDVKFEGEFRSLRGYQGKRSEQDIRQRPRR